jgi:hypothetical protein
VTPQAVSHGPMLVRQTSISVSFTAADTQAE